MKTKDLICKPIFEAIMETKEEYLQGMYESRRREFLEDMTIGDLSDLIPDELLKELLIDCILRNYLDKQINPEVR